MAITVKTQVTQMYVALFGRAPDAGGLVYWEDSVNGGKTLAKVAQEMYDTTDARAYYPAAATDTAVITSFYTNVLGRAPDAAGLTYWLAELAKTGATKGSVISDMLYAVTNYTGTDPLGLTSQKLFNNKVVVGQYYAETMMGGVTGASNAISTVTATSDVSSNAAIAAIIAGATITGLNFTLTTASDVPAMTAGNDIITGASGTLNATDVVTDSSKTDADSLTATVATVVAPTLTNVETISVAGQYATTGLDLAGVTGTKTLNLSAAIIGATATVNNAHVGVSNIVVTDTNIGTLTIAARANTGTGGKMTIDAASTPIVKLNGSNAADTFDVTVKTGSLLDLSGGTGGGTDAVTAHLTGGTAFTFKGLAAGAETLTFDSKTAANKVTVDTTLTGLTDSIVVTGDQALTIVASGDQFSNNATSGTLKGLTNTGTSTVTLQTNGAATTAADWQAAVANTINVNFATTAINVTVNEATTLKLSVANNASLYNINNATSTIAAAGTLNMQLAASQTATMTTGANVATLVIDTSASSGPLDVGTLALDNNTNTVVVTGTNNIYLGSTALTNTGDEVISASALTGKLTIDKLAQNATVIGGLGVDTITGTAAKTLLARGGDGNDVLTGASATDILYGDAGNDTLSGMAAADTIIGGAGADTIIGGAGIDSLTGGDGADIFDLQTIVATANRDVITDFATGVDRVGIKASDTTGGSAALTAVFDTTSISLVAGANAYVLGTGAAGKTSSTADVIAITATLSSYGNLSLTGATDGTELLKALSSTSTASSGLTVATAADKFYLVAYQGGKAYMYYADAGAGDTAVIASELNLVGVFDATTAFASGDFVITA